MAKDMADAGYRDIYERAHGASGNPVVLEVEFPDRREWPPAIEARKRALTLYLRAGLE